MGVVLFLILISGAFASDSDPDPVWLGQCAKVLEDRELFNREFDQTGETRICGPVCLGNLLPPLLGFKANRAELIEHLIREIAPRVDVDPKSLIEEGVYSEDLVAIARAYIKSIGGGASVTGKGENFPGRQNISRHDLLAASREDTRVLVDLSYSRTGASLANYSPRFFVDSHLILIESAEPGPAGSILATFRDPEFTLYEGLLLPIVNPETKRPSYQIVSDDWFYRNRVIVIGNMIRFTRT